MIRKVFLFLAIALAPTLMIVPLLLGDAQPGTGAAQAKNQSGDRNSTARSESTKDDKNLTLLASNETRSIVCVLVEVKQGETLTTEKLGMREIAIRVVPLGAITDMKSAIGRVTKYSIQKNHPVTENDLVAPAKHPK